MRSIIFLLGIGLWLGLSDPALAGPYDGKWIADIPAQGRCTLPAVMTVLVAGHDLVGNIHRADTDPRKSVAVTGTVDDDGNAVISVGTSPLGTMKFEGDHFDGTWNNGLCDNHAQGDRALDRAAEVALASARRPHQDHYGELIRRADAGDRTVDYTALRSESIYAPGWDFYSGEVGSLLDQANALVKGKDCPAAMEKLDQAIRLDFTADAAHALRSDCLKAAGQAAGAKIESDIADGLVHSLMDSGSGGGRGLISALSDNDGSSEQNAYVAFTQREEMDVLANRHIQVRVRQTEIRGANGRYYDLIKGVSVRNGGALDATLKSVYFDITGYVVGRVSRRAAAEAALASVH